MVEHNSHCHNLVTQRNEEEKQQIEPGPEKMVIHQADLIKNDGSAPPEYPRVKRNTDE
jgi:hypothetical protein